MSENPFSLLDFLGYFFPGATVLIALYHYVPAVNDMLAIKEDTSAIVYVICIIAAYVIGHVVALISSITIEKYAVWKYGYPSRYLLRVYSRRRYFHDEPMNNPAIGENEKKKYLRRKVAIKIFVLVLIAPVSILDFVLSWFGLDYYFTRRLSGQQVSMIRAKCINLYKKLNIFFQKKSVFQDDFHRIIHNYYYEKANGHSRRMENCIAVYDFLRAMSFVFDVLFFIVLIKGIISIDRANLMNWSFYIACYAILSYVCFMGFMKFYRKFTVENFMCLICDEELNIKNVEMGHDNPTTGNQIKQENGDITAN